MKQMDETPEDAHRDGAHEWATHSKCSLCRPRQVALDGTVREVMPGDKGVQGSLLGSPAQTGEGLTLETLPLFAPEDR